MGIYLPPLILEFRDFEPTPFFVLGFGFPGEQVLPLGIVWSEFDGDLLHDRAKFARIHTSRPQTIWEIRSLDGLSPTVSEITIDLLMPAVRRLLNQEAETRAKVRSCDL